MRIYFLIIFIFSIYVLVLANCSKSQPIGAGPNSESVKLLFRAVSLIGKTPQEVDKILGDPIEMMPLNNDPDREIHSYHLGKYTSVLFYKNKAASVVVYTNDQKLDEATAYKLLDIDYIKQDQTGIYKITTGKDFIKIEINH